MATIFKYILSIQDEQYLFVEEGAMFLTVQVQHRQPVLWAVVNAMAETVERKVYIRGTGHEMGEAESGQYVGTFQIEGGAFIGHVFVEEQH